jgi:pyruvate dehydrogenase E2 component (dihydrolipoamide acetyltransferase)
MPFEFKLPDLGEGITEGEVVKWKVKEGDPVEEHQVVVEVETDKAIVEVPSPKKGKVLRLDKGEGEVVEVGETLLTIELEGEEAVAGGGEKRAESVSVVGSVPEEEEVLASPKARGLARKLGVDISILTGTGPGGAVTEKDVKEAAGATEKRPAEKAEQRPSSDKFGPVERVPIKGIRKSIARNLIASQRSAAFVTGMDDADVTELWDLRKRETAAAKEAGVHLTFLPFFMKAVQHALISHPLLNGSMDEEAGEIIVKKYYNIGVAVDTPDGLMVSVVKDVDKKTILELGTELGELSRKANERKITLEELKGSTFTISNYGTFGGVYATPIINYPDVAILGTGRISEKPWVHEGEIVIRRILPLSLTFDHRVADGRDAARFLTRVIKYLEDPGKIFIESR